MRDIQYKKVGEPSPEALPSNLTERRIIHRPGLIEKIVAAGNRLGGWLRVSTIGYSQTVVTPIATELTLTPGGQVAPKRKRLATASRKVAGKVREHGKRVHRALKTPAGKVAAVQSLAILGLFAYVNQQNPGYFNAANEQVNDQGIVQKVRQYLPSARDAATPQPFQESKAIVTNQEIDLHAWLTPWNLEKLQENSGTYASVSAFWLTLNENGYDVTPKADWKSWDTFRQSARREGQETFLTISSDPDYSYKALSDRTVQDRQIATLLSVVKERGFDGIDIDYEGLGLENRELFTVFIRNLTAAFHSEEKKVAVTLEARLGNRVPMDWHNLGQIADEVRIMAYDYHSKNTNFPGPISPLGWVKEVADYAVSMIPPEKVIIGLGNYGYDWTLADGEEGGWQGVGVSFEQALNLAKEKNAPVIVATGIDDRGYDIGIAANFTYKDDQDKQHSVWFEDRYSLQSKVALLNQYPIQGIIFWSVGLGDRDFWESRTNR